MTASRSVLTRNILSCRLRTWPHITCISSALNADLTQRLSLPEPSGGSTCYPWTLTILSSPTQSQLKEYALASRKNGMLRQCRQPCGVQGFESRVVMIRSRVRFLEQLKRLELFIRWPRVLNYVGQVKSDVLQHIGAHYQERSEEH